MAEQRIGKLSILLSLGTSAFQTDLDRIENKLKGFGTSILKTAAGFAVYDIGRNLVTGFGNAVKEAFESIDNAAKSADRLGLATEEFASLQHAADLAGVDIASLEGTLGKFAKKLGEASIIGSEAAKSFRGIGLDPAALAGAGTFNALGMIGESLDALPNAFDKAYAAQQIFGKGGATMVTVLTGGGKALGLAREEAEMLGLTFSRAGAKGVEDFNDAVTRAKAVFTGFGRQIAVAASPGLEAMTTGFVSMIKEAGGVPAILDRIIVKVGDFGSAFLDALQSINDALVKIGVTTGTITSGFEKLYDVATYIPRKVGGSVWEGGKKLFGMESEKEKIAGPEKRWSEAFRDSVGGVRDSLKAMPMPEMSVDNLLGPLESVGFAMRGIDSSMKGPGAASLALADKLSELSEEMNRTAQTFGLGGEQVKFLALSQQAATMAGDPLVSKLLEQAQASVAQVDALRKIDEQTISTGNIFEDAHIKVQKLTELFGDKSPEIYATQVSRIGDALKKLETEKVGQLIESTRSPLERFRLEMAQLEGMRADLETGKPGISDELFGRGAAKAFQGVAKDFDFKLQLPQAATRESREAGTQIITAITQGARQNEEPINRVRRVLEQMKTSNDLIEKHAQDTAEALKNLKVLEV